ncbi:MAG TPA: asparaginase [Acidimicrobiia bacterium]|nr:asparaginase [Acidimicrobiia bacterium]
MLAASTRSGLVETMHDGAVAVVTPNGDLVAHSGDIDQPFYLRSAAKPFQALASQEHGAALGPLELALACASHDGHPVHVGLVESMLARAGLSEPDLQCPPSWPLSTAAANRLRIEMGGDGEPRAIWHDCSGKHAGWLRACHAQGWPLDRYLAPEHPIQVAITDTINDLGGFPASPVGVDGCGAPVHRTTTRAMATLYARLGSLPRLREVFDTMHRYPALVSGTGNGDASIATALNAAAKRGAAGCIGVAIDRRLGLAVKSWDGIQEVADAAAIATLSGLGELSRVAADRLAALARPTVLGGGRPVGELEPRVELTWS